ncbi:flagellar type III secretion system pore protein FliP [Clostridium sp. MD294]|uniref:flagellar type III secretion system pore protein FliP n=1 Tax=Clostridium sp. MD294 TaxID=97138 RepID=UPI0002CA13AC|nr:flagellar type III secretion system pore protein FliP [Clostridium sp. MD294]NDO46404.1 flagellar type III secretion system pore protein FliP [Clostridium sp. MD294]USF29166.1 Flagellar biosynthetic protein FliP [Clostridium sp. MD294]
MTDALINVNGNSVQTLEILFLLTVISLLPSILMLITAFTRILIVLSFLRNAIGLQGTPPNSVLIGLALFMTLFIMTPVVDEVNETAYVPYKNEEISQVEALERASIPIKRFMLENTKPDSLNLFLDFADIQYPQTMEQQVMDLPMRVVIPAFMTSELSRAFVMGFLLFIPFLLIDIVVSSTLMSMGMIMLPPATISLPFKILLFVTVDGWHLLFSTLVYSFN